MELNPLISASIVAADLMNVHLWKTPGLLLAAPAPLCVSAGSPLVPLWPFISSSPSKPTRLQVPSNY